MMWINLSTKLFSKQGLAIAYSSKIKTMRSPHQSTHQTAIAYSLKIKNNAITYPLNNQTESAYLPKIKN